MSSEEKIKAEIRTEFGKGAARRIRRDGKVPAVIYGHGHDPVHLTMPGHDTMMALKHGGANALLHIEADGKTLLALTKQVQVDPLKRALEHIDFVEVKKGEKVNVDVPIIIVGEAEAGTLVVTENSTVELEAEATHIPEHIEVNVEGLTVGTLIHASDLVLPKGSILVTEAEAVIVNVAHAPTAEEVEADIADGAAPTAEPTVVGAESSEG
ncbi:MAG: 50S ribosomal protein L25/general stress protein Ctc [Marmoricola sp.]